MSESQEASRPQLLGHPKGLFVLFGAETWERFSFYGMRALLTLYMVKVLQYSDTTSSGVYAAYGALVYFFPVLGGLIADKILGYRRSIMLGGLLMAVGHAVMAFDDESLFFAALAFLCVGNGFFKPNISSAVGKLYEPGDARRDAGFTIFYMGINMGAMLAPFVCGPLGENVGWHWGFGLAAIGMLIGLVTFALGTGSLKGCIEPQDPELAKRMQSRIVLGSVLIVPLVAVLLKYNEIVHYLVPLAFIGVLVSLHRIARQETKVGRDRLYALIMLMGFHTAFWAFFEQAGSSLALFTDRCVNRNLPIIGEQPASWFQGVNGGFILLLAIPMSILWTKLAKANKNPSIPAKFVWGLGLIAAGFLTLAWGAAGTPLGERTSWFFLMGLFLLNTLGELCISPVGLSAVTKLAPQRYVGYVMGAWMLTISLGHSLAGAIAKLTNISFPEGSVLHELTRPQYVLPEGMNADNAATLLGAVEKGSGLKGAMPLGQLLDKLGEFSIAPAQALESFSQRNLLDAAQLAELKQIAGGPALQSAAQTVSALDSHVVGPVTEVYASVYQNVGFGAAGLTVLLLVLAGPIRKRMHGVV